MMKFLRKIRNLIRFKICVLGIHGKCHQVKEAKDNVDYNVIEQ